MKKRIIMSDIARMANVSKSTVSLILNNRTEAKFSKETRDKVFQLACQHNFKLPYLNTDKKEIIGIVISRHIKDFFNDPYYLKIYESLNKYLEKNKFLTVILNYTQYFSENSGITPGESIYCRKLDGLVIMGTVADEFIQQLLDIKIKFILVNFSSEKRINSVWFDNRLAVIQIIDFLISKNHKNIALLYPDSGGMNYQLRTRSFTAYMQEKKLKAFLFKTPDNTRKGVYHAAGSFAGEMKYKKITALIGSDDIMALGAMKALEDNNLKIPDDISVVGIDDIPDAEKSSPSLTTIRVPAEEIGEIAGKKIIEMLFEEKNIIQKIELGTELMIRESSGPAKVN
ncbi:MAG: hypothetical protein A2096_00655 [Spirochaetes bacterium GWF1_41_5]|nr:MAG: hypothetical protein A2096_00655 [Spirochaetes bacterium GWF1_41_5]